MKSQLKNTEKRRSFRFMSVLMTMFALVWAMNAQAQTDDEYDVYTFSGSMGSYYYQVNNGDYIQNDSLANVVQIVFVGNDLYIVGCSKSNPYSKSILFKNLEPIREYDGIADVAVSGNDIYATIDADPPFYWKNSEVITLPPVQYVDSEGSHSSGTGGTKRISADNENVIAYGSFNHLWINGTLNVMGLVEHKGIINLNEGDCTWTFDDYSLGGNLKVFESYVTKWDSTYCVIFSTPPHSVLVPAITRGTVGTGWICRYGNYGGQSHQNSYEIKKIVSYEENIYMLFELNTYCEFTEDSVKRYCAYGKFENDAVKPVILEEGEAIPVTGYAGRGIGPLANLPYDLKDMAISNNGNVYVLGTYTGTPSQCMYWKNGEKVVLAEGNFVEVYQMQIIGNDVYVYGTEDRRTNNKIIWKNGEIYRTFVNLAKTFAVVPRNVSTISETNAQATLHIYPNPAKDELLIESGDLKIESVEIVDITGKTIQQFSSVTTINVSHLSSGIYFVKIKTDKGELTKKVIKE